jgi:hypothetical protein
MFEAADRGAAVAGKGVTVIALFQRSIEDAIATTAGSAVGTAEGIGAIGVLVAFIALLTGIDAGIAAERREEGDLFGCETLPFHAAHAVGAVIVRDTGGALGGFEGGRG